MGPLIISQFVVCGICLAIGLLHLATYARLPQRKADLFFSLMCFLNAAGAFLEALTYRTVELQTYNALYKLQVSVQGCLWIAMVWFIALLTGSTRRWVVKTVTAAYGLAVLINILSPYGILYATIETLDTVRLPWGEELYFRHWPVQPLAVRRRHRLVDSDLHGDRQLHTALVVAGKGAAPCLSEPVFCYASARPISTAALSTWVYCHHRF